jgi:hypothetical protein
MIGHPRTHGQTRKTLEWENEHKKTLLIRIKVMLVPTSYIPVWICTAPQTFHIKYLSPMNILVWELLITLWSTDFMVICRAGVRKWGRNKRNKWCLYLDEHVFWSQLLTLNVNTYSISFCFFWVIDTMKL